MSDLAESLEMRDYLEPIMRLTRDIKSAAFTLGDDEARFLVDFYYIIQEDRKRSYAQVRALEANEEPNTIINWFAQQSDRMENEIKEVLNVYTTNHPMGSYMRSIYGIGPVLSAGLLAHIDISKASTVGKIWQYAGIAGPVANVDTMRFQYRVTFEGEVDQNNPPKLMLEKQQEATFLYPDGEDENGNSILLYQIILAGDEKPPKVVAPNNITYTVAKRVLSGQTPWLKGQKRPFNANLKVLLWKVGQSFMKFSNKPQCYYGKVYRDRKIYEIERNEAGELKDQAAAKLLVLKDKTTDVYKCYESGKLPPGHIDARARRYAVKLFLAHMWETWYKLHFKKDPPLPYPIAILGHADYIPPPV